MIFNTSRHRIHYQIPGPVAKIVRRLYIIPMVNFPAGHESLISQTKNLLQKYELKARKGLGQHFLVNSRILKNILRAADLSSGDTVIEIGPGMGVLTRELVEQSGYVIAVELDNGMVELLQETLADYPNISIIHRNVLETEPEDLIEQEKSKFPATISTPEKYKLVANLPYYITQPIIRHFCEARLKPQVMVIMVQKEVARNIVAQPGDLSILAISVQFYGRPQIVGYVPANNFYPAPKVDSAILKIDLYPRPPVEVTGEKSFFKVVRAGFCAARKQLGNSLAQGLDIPKPEALSLLQKAEVSPQKRPEVLTLEEWARLEKVYSEAKSI
jgi:16S rRNA (adenine1518-N6/adenine1519-N6)-dimethyltransferase